MDGTRRLSTCRDANAQVWAGESGLRPGGALAGDDDVLIFATGLPAPQWNGGILLREPTSLVDTLQAVRGFFGLHRLPFGCLLPTELTAALSTQIARASFTVERDEHALMALEPAELRAPALPAGLEIREVADGREIDEHVAVVASAFLAEPDPVATGWLADLVAPQVGRPGYRHLTGYVDGRPVCVATGTRTEETIAVFGVGTLHTHRGRGLASALTAEVVRGGFADGARLGWLNPSPMARAAYAGLGFADLPGWSVLTPQS